MNISKKILKPRAKYQLSCGPIIFHIHEGRPHFLLVKYPTYWGFVKGQVDPGETEEMTAFREAFEEVGLGDLQFIPGFREVAKMYFRDPMNREQMIRKEAVFLLAQTWQWNVRISHEHEDFKWCTFEKALAIVKVKGVKRLLADANYFVEKNFDLNLGILKQRAMK